MHGFGHFQLGGPELDVYVSPSDPVFWLHHAQVDRLWAIWQHGPAGPDLPGLGDRDELRRYVLSPLARESEVSILGEQVADLTAVPPSPNVTLDTPINFGVISPPKLIRKTVSTIDGDLCYVYE